MAMLAWPSCLETTRSGTSRCEDEVVALGLARIEAHYFLNNIFLPEASPLINAGRLRSIPGIIVQGRYDTLWPIVTAHELNAGLATG